MATWTATNVLSGTTEGPKYNQIGSIDEVWSVSLTTALANGDTIVGPTMPAGCYLTNVTVDTGSLDSSTGITFEVGYTGHLAAFIAASAVGQGGGVQGANVAGTVGFTSTTNTQFLATITHAATTAVAGKFVIKVSYTASP